MMTATQAPAEPVYVEATRAHVLDGRPIPSVTQILSATGFRDDFRHVAPDVVARKGLIGHAVHMATHYHDEGDLRPDSVGVHVRGYLDGWTRLLEDRRLSIVALETIVYSRVYHFIGRLDRLALLPDRRLVVLDLKIGDPDAAAADLQLAGYEVGLREARPDLDSEPIARWSVQLREDGTYRLEQYPKKGRTHRQDRMEFLAAACVVNARTARNGGTPCWNQ